MATVGSTFFPHELRQDRRVTLGRKTEQVGRGAKVEGHFIPRAPRFAGGFHVRLEDVSLGKVDISFTRLGQELTRFDNVLTVFAAGIGYEIASCPTVGGILVVNNREYMFKAASHDTRWNLHLFTGGRLVSVCSGRKPE